MIPLNEPMPGSDPPEHQRVQREPFEYLFDCVLLLGAAVNAWNALVVTKLLAGRTVFVSHEWLMSDSTDMAMFAVALAVVSIMEYPAFLVILNRPNRDAEENPWVDSSKRLIMQAAFAAAPWIYLFVFRMMQPPGI